MKDYKRYTSKDGATLTMSQWGGSPAELELYRKLAECEDKIEQLEAINEKYLDSIESVQAGRCRLRCELTEQAVKQAKIDVLTECKEKSYVNNYCREVVRVDNIDKMIEELKK